MSRSDNWKPHEDKLLIETVLNYMRNGKSQLRAFNDVGESLNRSAAGVGFRWNGELRKHYSAQIQEAKRIKNILKSSPTVNSTDHKASVDDISPNKINEIVDYLNELYSYDLSTLKSINETKESIHLIEDRIEDLRTQISESNNSTEIDNEDIKALTLLFKKANEIITQKENKKPAI
ncbi:hypothetical protein [Paenibacillus sp. Marseille-Q4541]|uniref:hypothetical protein n=1 Tax=Paenibacillus sp. Marseille-Q4541 TaxID=2831522 RepID=UPI001BABA6BE|nr:hypothetical protein [Paenibacillus sp. Marseille-Q4541]